MSLTNDITAALKRFAKVPVYMGERQLTSEQSIVISPVKLNGLIDMYDILYGFVYTIWRNIPSPTDCESTYVVIWMISAENYDVNHFTVSWENSSADTFVHLWSSMDRLKSIIDSYNANWLLGARNPIGYTEAMGMTGPADVFLYPKDRITAPHIGVLVADMRRCKVTEPRRDYSSFYDFRMSMRLRKIPEPLDVNKMIMRNESIMEKNATRNAHANNSSD